MLTRLRGREAAGNPSRGFFFYINALLSAAPYD